jgi:mRNA-degrading endonuclease RelE of RelBE toxin-antitoxin system
MVPPGGVMVPPGGVMSARANWEVRTDPPRPFEKRRNETRKDSITLQYCTALPYNSGMVFIETSLFSKLVYKYLSEDEFLGLQNYLLEHPERGDIVPGSGGVRKVRWAMTGRGKRGGVRVIYYWKQRDDEIWLLTIYAKNEASTIPGHILKKIAEEIKNE